MTALLAGLDFSSKAIHAALIPLDEDDHDTPLVTLRVFEFASFKTGATTPAYRSVERCRSVRGAMRELLKPTTTIWAGGDCSHSGPSDYTHHDVAHVCVEEPFGQSRKADNVMRELFGAILASIPTHIERDTIQTREWRELTWPGLVGQRGRDWKQNAIARAEVLTGCVRTMNEHEAEAFLIARAARTRLHDATKATTT